VSRWLCCRGGYGAACCSDPEPRALPIYQGFRSSSGSLAMLAAIRRASSPVSKLVVSSWFHVPTPWMCASTYSWGVANLHYSPATRF